MSAALFPGPDEPDGSGLPGDGDGGAGAGVPQGLYVTLPAEELSLDGFAEAGRADTMAPGPLLAMVLDTVAGDTGEGLSGLSDDQLVGFLPRARRMESRLAWAKMAALAEFASRPRRTGFAADGTAAAHACAAGSRPWPPGQGPLGQQPGSTTQHGLLDLPNITSLTPRHPRPLPARPGRGPLPPQPQTPAFGQGKETRPAPHLAAAAGRPAATWTIPSPMTRAAGPVNATWRHCAVITIAVSKPRAGG